MARAKKMMEETTDPLDSMLARLQLSGIRDQLDNLLDEAARANLSARETLILLCEREIARKDHRRIEMALKLAHFPAVKELAGFDFEAQPSIDPKQIRDLAASRWIANGENVLLLGAARRWQDALVNRAGARGNPGRVLHHGDDAGRRSCQGARRPTPGRETARAIETKAAHRR
jgi:IstB-like ATP binding protein